MGDPKKVPVRGPKQLPTYKKPPSTTIDKIDMPDSPVLDDKPKWIGQSKGIVGPLLVIVVVVLRYLGLDVETAHLEPIAEFVRIVLSDGAITIGAILGLIGRYVADRRVTLWPSESKSK